MRITERSIAAFKKSGKQYDEDGLFLLHKLNGSKLWRFRYWEGGKEKNLALGAYPGVSIQDARRLRDEAQKKRDAGKDPAECRKAEKIEATLRAVNTFRAVALEWFEVRRHGWTVGHAKHIMNYFTKDVFPWMGDRPIAEITPPELLAVVRRVEARAIPTAHRVLGVCGDVFRYAVGTGRAERDPSADLRGTLKPKPKEKNRAAVTDPEMLGKMLRSLDTYAGGFNVRCAVRLALYLFQRPGELVAAEWKDINFDKAEWSFHVTKVDIPHKVPLASQVVGILQELHKLTGDSRYVFAQASNNEKHISTDTVRLAIRSCGIPKEMFTTQGARATACTLLDEVLRYPKSAIEKQLSHAVPDVNGTAYNRSQYLDERRMMMQKWADYLDVLKTDKSPAPTVA
ncbi:MAG TPA: integrase arm-type DNA-binding domain-containing protein [Candidatus Ozemobacteraceae bacterium]